MVSGYGTVEIFTSEYGIRDAPAIVLVHGLQRDHTTWRGQVESELARRYRLICLDLRGHGRSGRPRDPAAYRGGRLWAGDVKAVLDHYGLERPILLGWSFGGKVVLDYAAAYGPDSISGLVLVSTAVADVDRGGRRSGKTRGTDPESEWVAAAILGGEPRDRTAALEGVRAPVLILHGARDAIVPPSHADYIESHAADSTKRVFDAVGHSPHLDAEEEFNRQLLDFADRVYGPGR